MKYIAEYIDLLDEEIEGAKTYAEKYVQFKAENEITWANKFKEMSNAELQHSTVIHEYLVQKINQLKTVYQAPTEMQEIWDKKHAKYIERTAWIKQILTM